MNQLRVRILEPDDRSQEGTVYQSGDVEPRRLELAGANSASGGMLYDKILDLPQDRAAVWPAEYLFVVGIDLNAGYEDDFENWYNTEHLPALAQVAGVNRAVRFKRAEPSNTNADAYPVYLALYDITHPEIAGNAEWQAAVNTPWTIRLRPHFQVIWRGGYRLVEERD